VSAAIVLIGAEHERHVIGGGQTSVKLPQFKAVNTLLGNLKTSSPAPATPSTSPSTRTATVPNSSTASTTHRSRQARYPRSITGDVKSTIGSRQCLLPAQRCCVIDCCELKLLLPAC